LISIAAFLDFKKIRLPHLRAIDQHLLDDLKRQDIGMPLLDHAKAGGEEAVPVVALLQTLEPA